MGPWRLQLHCACGRRWPDGGSYPTCSRAKIVARAYAAALTTCTRCHALRLHLYRPGGRLHQVVALPAVRHGHHAHPLLWMPSDRARRLKLARLPSRMAKATFDKQTHQLVRLEVSDDAGWTWRPATDSDKLPPFPYPRRHVQHSGRPS